MSGLRRGGVVPVFMIGCGVMAFLFAFIIGSVSGAATIANIKTCVLPPADEHGTTDESFASASPLLASSHDMVC